MERVANNVTADQIQAMDQNGFIKRNLVDAPIKDTVAVPDGGYTIVRFIASNPGDLTVPFLDGNFSPAKVGNQLISFDSFSGYWLFHCHLSFHIEVGMGLIFKVGEHHHFPPAPANFPKCGSWLPPVDEEELPISIQDLPYNVSYSKTNSKTEPPPSSSAGDDSSINGSGEPGLVTDLPITLPDEENFVSPQRLINGTLSHSESPAFQTTSGSRQTGNYLPILSVALSISYICTGVHFRR